VFYLHKYSHGFSQFPWLTIEFFRKASVTTLATLKANWWRQQQSRHVLDTSDQIPSDGLRAFAKQQATHEVAIAADWWEKWTAVRVHAQPIIEGLSDV